MVLNTIVAPILILLSTFHLKTEILMPIYFLFNNVFVLAFFILLSSTQLYFEGIRIFAKTYYHFFFYLC